MARPTYDTLLYSSERLTLGKFDCPRQAQHFQNTGPIGGYLMAFPSAAVKIRHADMAQWFVADINGVTIYNKGQEYERFALSDYGDLCHWISIEADIAAEIIAAILGPQGPQRDAIFPTYHGLISNRSFVQSRELFNCLNSRAASDALFIEETALALLHNSLCEALSHPLETSQCPKRLTTAGKHRRVAQQACALLSESVQENLSLGEIAATLHVSPFHLARLFRAQCGVPLYQYLRQLRLRLAAQNIADGEQDLTQLSMAWGFSDHSHFSLSFRQQFAISPSTFRRRLARTN